MSDAGFPAYQGWQGPQTTLPNPARQVDNLSSNLPGYPIGAGGHLQTQAA
jgi:hypothetical protein